MKKHLLMLPLILLAARFTYAQEAKKAQPDSVIKIIPITDGAHTGYVYTIGGKLQSPEDVKLRLLSYAPSAQEFHLLKNNITWSYLSLAGFTASGVGAFIEFKNNNKYAGATPALVNGTTGFNYQQHSNTGAYVFTAIATGFIFSTLFNFARAAKHNKKALELYNKRFE